MLITQEYRDVAVDCINQRPAAKMYPLALELVKQGVCPICDKKHDQIRPDSIKEFFISGMCQECQDQYFGGSDE